MSNLMAVGDVCEVRLNTGDGLSQFFNILHYELQGISDSAPGPPPTVLDASDFLGLLATSVFTNLEPDWSAATPTTQRFYGVTAQSIYPDPRSRPYNYFPVAPGEGVVEAESLPGQDCATLLKKSVFGNRWGLGRFFFSGIPESFQENGIMSDPYVILLQAFCDELNEGYAINVGTVTGTWAPILFGPGDAPGTVRKTAIVEVDVSDNVIKTQRRRRPGKGI